MFVQDVVQVERPFEAIAPYFLRDPAWLDPLVAAAAGHCSVRCQRGIARSRADSLVVPMRWTVAPEAAFPALDGDLAITPTGPATSQISFAATYTLITEHGAPLPTTERSVEVAVGTFLDGLAAVLHLGDGPLLPHLRHPDLGTFGPAS